MAEFNYRDYVTFLPPDFLIKYMEEEKIDFDKIKLPDEELQKIENALSEMASTPEGQKALMDAASKSANGKICILHNDGGLTYCIKHETHLFLLLGSIDSNFQYADAKNGSFHDVSIQRLLYHEIQHIALGHDKHTGDEDHLGVSHTEEAEAVRATNKYMKKYYNEPPRNEDTNKAKFEGTKEWDFNKNFNDAGRLRKFLKKINIFG